MVETSLMFSPSRTTSPVPTSVLVNTLSPSIFRSLYQSPLLANETASESTVMASLPRLLALLSNG